MNVEIERMQSRQLKIYSLLTDSDRELKGENSQKNKF